MIVKCEYCDKTFDSRDPYSTHFCVPEPAAPSDSFDSIANRNYRHEIGGSQREVPMPASVGREWDEAFQKAIKEREQLREQVANKDEHIQMLNERIERLEGELAEQVRKSLADWRHFTAEKAKLQAENERIKNG